MSPSPALVERAGRVAYWRARDEPTSLFRDAWRPWAQLWATVPAERAAVLDALMGVERYVDRFGVWHVLDGVPHRAGGPAHVDAQGYRSWWWHGALVRAER